MSESLEEFLARSLAERVAAGFPEHLEDEATLNRIVAIVANIPTDTGRTDSDGTAGP
jgi:hypothetical protein